MRIYMVLYYETFKNLGIVLQNDLIVRDNTIMAYFNNIFICFIRITSEDKFVRIISIKKENYTCVDIFTTVYTTIGKLIIKGQNINEVNQYVKLMKYYTM
ncbi:hypothetical protein V1478_014201 [Vespula squamosa]|uniref:Uncharacterized protein n=1 Tax=Vespula squamosa TaxID=30214 RepID=A0ABD2A9Y2_VESSQ